MKTCIECGRPAIVNAVGKRCSACYYRELRRRHRHKQLVCKYCGMPFISVRRDAYYCSHACRQKAYRQRAERG